MKKGYDPLTQLRTRNDVFSRVTIFIIFAPLMSTGCLNRLYQSRITENQLYVYASVNAYDKRNSSKVLSKIKDYKENISKRNLLIINLKPFYNSALRGDLIPFEELRTQIQQELERT